MAYGLGLIYGVLRVVNLAHGGIIMVGAYLGWILYVRTGLDPYLAITGMFGLLYLFGASFLAPRVGIALFVGSVTAGTLIASLGLDHVGAFGGVVQRITFIRVVGLFVLLAGVAMIRSGR